MTKTKINLTFDCFTMNGYLVRTVIRRCIEETLASEGITVGCEINVLVTNDRGIHAINLASRGVDKATDVLSFPMFQLTAGALPTQWDSFIDPDTDLCPLGDMAISYERAAKQAKEFGHSLRREIGYLTIHSILHLLGYDHLDEGEEKAKMRHREEEIASNVWGLQR